MKITRLIIYLIFPLLTLMSCKTQRHANSYKLSEKDRLDFTFLYFNATKETLLGNYSEAAKLFEKCIQIDGSNPAPMFELGKIYLQKNDLKYAEFLLKAATEFDPQNFWYQFYYAEALKKNKKFQEVVKVYEKLVKYYPQKTEYYYELANAYQAVNRVEDALKTYVLLEKKIGVTEEVAIQKQRLYLHQGKFDKACAEVQKLIDTNPGEMQYYNYLAELYLVNGFKEKALEVFNRALKLSPENPYVHLGLSEYYKEIQDKDNYFKELIFAFGSPELDIDTKVKKLLSFYTLSETSDEYKVQSYKLLDAMVASNPKEAKTFSFYGDFLYRDGRMREARDSYLKAVEFDKSKLVIWNQVLFIDNDLSDFAQMDTHSVQAIELFPNEASLYLLNGIANIQNKKTPDAIYILNKGLSLVVDNSMMLGQFYANLGDCYYRSKEMAKSDSSYDKALELNPNDVYVLNNYSYYLSLRNEKMEKAEAMSKKSNELEPNNASYQDTYGWILYGLKKYDLAKTWLEKALANGGEKNGTIMEHYGDILYKLNDPRKALEYWTKAQLVGAGSETLQRKINE
jgi:tetratricopeptide (TPR) repeat protein